MASLTQWEEEAELPHTQRCSLSPGRPQASSKGQGEGGHQL